MSLVRFGVSLEKELLIELDNYVLKNKFPNRSQAIRQLVADIAIKEKIRHNEIVAGAITFFYNHHKNNLLKMIQDTKTDYLSVILSSTNFHIDVDHSMEIIAVKGFSYRIKEFSENLIALKGIVYGSLSITK